MDVRFWLSRYGSTEEFVLPVSEELWRRHEALTKADSRMAFWLAETGDKRFDGPWTAFVVEPA